MRQGELAEHERFQVCAFIIFTYIWIKFRKFRPAKYIPTYTYTYASSEIGKIAGTDLIILM